MKKALFYISAATVVIAGCTKQDADTPQENNASKEIVLKVKAENNNTKATYNLASGANQGQFKWATGDIIGVYAYEIDNESKNNWPMQLSLSKGDGETEATFTGSLGDGFAYGKVAFYPWNGWKDSSPSGTNYFNGTLYVRLKEDIDYANGSSNPQHLLPLAATIENGQTEDIEFKHLGAGIAVTINDVPKAANKVSLTIPNKNITGEFAVAYGVIGTDSGYITATEGSNSTVSISFPTAEAKRNMTFIFPMPTLTLNSLTIKLYRDTNTEIWSKTATHATSQTLSRGEILNMAPITVPSDKTVTVGVISYLINELGSDNWRIWYGGENVSSSGHATLKAVGGDPETKDVGYWGSAQSFTMFTADVPIDAKFKVWWDNTEGDDRWFGDVDATANYNKAYVFNYSGDKAIYE